jgi:probable addiction module antidote protein
VITVRKKTESYKDYLNEALQDSKLAASYLSAASDDSLEIFLVAMRDVADAHLMSRVAAGAALNRVSLYKALSANGNPHYETLKKILGAFGLKFAIVQADAPRKSTKHSRKLSRRTPRVRVALRARRKLA